MYAMSNDYEGDETFRVEVNKELVDRANKEFTETTIKGLVRRSMEEGIKSRRKEETYMVLITGLSQSNSLLTRIIYQLLLEDCNSKR